MIIDAWAQHPTIRHITDPIFEPLRRWMRQDSPLPGDGSGELPVSWTLDSMDEANVAMSLITAWIAPNRVMISNDEVAGFVNQANGRLAGVGSVDITKPTAAVRELRRCIKDLGFKAVRVLPWLWEVPPTHARLYPIYSECCELGIPFCTQVGHTGPLMPSEVGRPIPYIDQVALDFPELVIVGGHIGYPWTEEMIAVCTKHRNVYIDTSAYTVSRFPEALVQYMRHHGRNKVLFGSNWPMMSPAKALQGFENLGLDSEASQLYLSGNALRVFKLDPPKH